MSEDKIILLFDVDGTLTIPRNTITKEMASFLRQVSKYVILGVVGGSDYTKMLEQIGSEVSDFYLYFIVL